GDEPSRAEEPGAAGHFLQEFRLENQLPIWRYQVDGVVLEKSLVFLHGQNTVHINYQLLSDQPEVRLELRPSMHFRGHEQAVNDGPHEGYRFSVTGDQYEVSLDNLLPRLRLVIRGD